MYGGDWCVAPKNFTILPEIQLKSLGRNLISGDNWGFIRSICRLTDAVYPIIMSAQKGDLVYIFQPKKGDSFHLSLPSQLFDQITPRACVVCSIDAKQLLVY